MELFTILKKSAQIGGVFPFEKKLNFSISKLYVVVNLFVGFCLVVIAWFHIKNLEETSKPNKLHPLFSKVNTFSKVIAFARISASLAAVLTKIIWIREHVKILNAIFDFSKNYRLTSVSNSTRKSDYFLTIVLCFALLNEISSSIDDGMSNYVTIHTVYFRLKPLIACPMIIDEIIFCVICSTLSKYQQAIKQMILSNAESQEIEEFNRNNQNLHNTAAAGNFFWSQLQQVNVIERPIEGISLYGRSVSVKAEKLEYFRKMNLKIFNMYSNYSALHQYQLFLSTAVLTMTVINIIFISFAAFTQDIITKLTSYLVLKTLIMLGYLVSNFIRIFTLCHYNDKAFNEGTDTKYVIQEIRRTSNDKEVIKVSKIFIEQLDGREQFKIFGVFAFNAALPMTFVEYAINYVVVLVQYLHLNV